MLQVASLLEITGDVNKIGTKKAKQLHLKDEGNTKKIVRDKWKEKV